MLIDNSALSFANAAAAIIQREDGKYLLQKRDDRPDIWYPGHWGCFGGAIDGDESPEQALRRELMEELSLDIGNAHPFVSLDFDLAGMGLGFYRRFYYTVAISSLEEGAINLGEGSAIAAFDAQTMLSNLRVTPYDSFALFLHASKHRFSQQSAKPE